MDPGNNWDTPIPSYSQQGGFDYGNYDSQQPISGTGVNATGNEYAATSHFESNNNLPEGEEDELPLLEELGINPQHIKDKAMSVLNPFKIKNTDSCREYIEDEDLAGPLCFALLLGFAMMLGGKMHFGHIYAYGVSGCGLVWCLLNLMNEPGVGLQFIISILGYNLLPLVFLAFLSGLGVLLLSITSFFMVAICSVFILWSSWCSTRMLVVGLNMEHQRWLLFYPLLLFYTTFALITVF
eukprot:TRINITY_DN21181_c0_g1_i2.p1 TRINITY_DN21181_c0_g1~~TRINITY_DN21181_c0_g1_i2.p1  ORF type:complete len:266 (+),score=27.87 TRINITY_DN21181_c0_g1_i2:84-800(+)